MSGSKKRLIAVSSLRMGPMMSWKRIPDFRIGRFGGIDVPRGQLDVIRKDLRSFLDRMNLLTAVGFPPVRIPLQ